MNTDSERKNVLASDGILSFGLRFMFYVLRSMFSVRFPIFLFDILLFQIILHLHVLP